METVNPSTVYQAIAQHLGSVRNKLDKEFEEICPLIDDESYDSGVRKWAQRHYDQNVYASDILNSIVQDVAQILSLAYPLHFEADKFLEVAEDRVIVEPKL